MIEFLSEYFLRIKIGKLLAVMLQSTCVSLEVFFLTLIFSVPLALFICFGRMSAVKIVAGITNLFLLIIRGTPLMLQLIFVYFAPQMIFGIGFDRFTAAIVAMVINYAAYFAEIYRGGIESMPQGQYEAAKILGYTKAQTFIRIILPQVIKRILPAITNETITLVKDTSLAFTIGVTEMFTMAKALASGQVSMLPYAFAALFYYILNLVVAFIMERIEKKMNYYR